MHLRIQGILAGHVFQRGHVLDDPDGPAVRPDDQVVLPWVDDQIVHRHRGKALGSEAGPAFSPVDGHPSPHLVTGEEEAGRVGMFPHHVHRVVRESSGDTAPRFPEVLTHEEPGSVVVVPVSVEGHVDQPGDVVGGLDPAHVGPWRQRRDPLYHVGPAGPSVTGHLEVAVVGPDPKHIGVEG
jgi:hypothetical protein